MEAVVAAFNKEKALVGAFSVITNLRMELFEALVATCHYWPVSHPGYSDGGHLGSVDVLYQLPNLSSGENTMDWSIINE